MGSRRFPRISVERLLQILVALLAFLGSVLLGMGQGSPVLPLLMAGATVSALLLTDIFNVFRLHRAVANIAALVAVVYSLGDFMNNDSHQQLLAIANLLIYLQIVLLFQRKNERIYWQLPVLSLLQVVVAAALNVGAEFGVMLLIFVTVAFLSLATFFIYRSSRMITVASEDQRPAPAGNSRSDYLGAPPRTEAIQSPEEVGRQILGWPFLTQAAMLGVVALAFSLVYFYCSPRSSTSFARTNARQVSGFSDEVTLEEMGRLLLSDELVMRVQFVDLETKTSYPLFAEPYLRGKVMTNYSYDGSNGRWSDDSQRVVPRPIRVPSSVPGDGDLVRQDYLVQPSDQLLLFCAAPPFALPTTPMRLRFEPLTNQLYRRFAEVSEQHQPFRYSLGTSSFRGGTQRPFTIPFVLDTLDARRELEAEKLRTSQLDPLQFPQLVALTQDLLIEAGLDNDSDPIRVARLLENHLKNTENFTYTLNFNTVRDQRTPGMDPIEDFVVNHHRGHCEYFASALVLMLRSCGIPARMVVGYRGGELNSVGQYYQVRQRNAHAWVEAFVEADDLPAELRDDTTIGAWMRLDPTPSSSENNDERSVVMRSIDQMLDYAQLLWNDYVVGLTPERQQQSIFDPLSQRSRTATDWMQQLTWRERLSKWLAAIGIAAPDGNATWFSWRGGLAAMILATLAILGYRLLARFGRFSLLRWLGVRRPSSDVRQHPRVDFYEQAERLLEGLGCRRDAGQTHREFAAATGVELADRVEDPALATDLVKLVETFYRVRFGRQTLDETDRYQIEALLDRLRAASNRRSRSTD